LLDQLETFGGESRRVVRNASDVAARMRQAVDKMRCNRITGSDVDHRRHIRYLAGKRRWKTTDDQHIDLVSFHIAYNRAKLAGLTTRAARLERKVFAERVAVLLQLLQQNRPKRRLLVNRRTREERADTIDLGLGLGDPNAGAGD
jgi:hypothetical protein